MSEDVVCNFLRLIPVGAKPSLAQRPRLFLHRSMTRQNDETASLEHLDRSILIHARTIVGIG